MSNRLWPPFANWDVIDVAHGNREAEYYYPQHSDRACARRRIISISQDYFSGAPEWVAQFGNNGKWSDLCEPTSRHSARDAVFPRVARVRAVHKPGWFAANTRPSR